MATEHTDDIRALWLMNEQLFDALEPPDAWRAYAELQLSVAFAVLSRSEGIEKLRRWAAEGT